MKTIIEIAIFAVCVLLIGHVTALNNPPAKIECRK